MSEQVAHVRYREKPFIGSSHNWAKNFIASRPIPKSVLDIGAGSGVMGRELRAITPSVLLHAVDTCPETRSHLMKAGYDLVVEDKNELVNEGYDLILLLDVLEHMINPFEFLSSLPRLVNPGGRILISVPNITHWSIRVMLLFGYFEYTERGILDKTHLQFFSHTRVKSLGRSLSGFLIEEMAASIPPLEFVLPEWAWQNQIFRTLSNFHQGLAQVVPGVFAYQHLMALRRV